MDALGLDGGLAGTILRLLLIPVLAPINESWLPLRRHLPWEAGYCPTCGGWPVLGENRGLQKIRVLRCGQCTADWAFPTRSCPFCREDDSRFLGFLPSEGTEGKFGASTCEVCHGYLKMVCTATPLSGPRLLVADLASMHLDLAAPEKGYSAPE
jgi:FdhE protein